MKHIPNIEDAGDIAGLRVLLRLDLNTPVIDGKVADPYRIERIIHTIDTLRLKKAKVVIIAHTESKENTSLLPMFDYVKGFIPISFSEKLFGPEAIFLLDEMKDGDVLMFENLRLDPGEKANDIEFAKKLASYGDIYINDAFSVSHRAHASIVSLPALLPHYAGPLFIEEVTELSKAFTPTHPFVFILGGAKFDTKLPLIQKYLATADSVVIVGALANTVYKTQGYEVGTSLVSSGDFGIEEFLKNPKFVVPTDVTVKKIDGSVESKKVCDVLSEEYIADIGPETLQKIQSLISSASMVVWNGPSGNFEIGFTKNTEDIARAVTSSHAVSIVGGGDTLSAIQSVGVMDKFSFVSTAGGAMLDFLVNETLPGIDALTK
jgi:phosphoglycerate kinase